MSRLTQQKGTDVLLDAAEELLRDPQVHLVFAGRGGLVPRLERLAARHPRIHVLGYLADRALLGRVFASADVYLATCPCETFGLSVLEAFASGLPVLAADGGGAAELVNYSAAGRLYRRGDPASLIAETRALLGDDLPRLAQSAATYAAQQRSATESIQELCRHYERLIREANSGRSRSDHESHRSLLHWWPRPSSAAT